MSKFVLRLWSADRLDHHSPMLPVSGRGGTQNGAYLMKTQITQNQPTLSSDVYKFDSKITLVPPQASLIALAMI